MIPQTYQTLDVFRGTNDFTITHGQRTDDEEDDDDAYCFKCSVLLVFTFLFTVRVTVYKAPGPLEVECYVRSFA